MAKLEVVTITELRIASRNPQGKNVDTHRLALAIHTYIVTDGYIFDSKAEEWVNIYFDAVKKALDTSGDNSSEILKKIFTLMHNALQVNERRMIRRPRQKSTDSVAIAA